jgi:hypothetical protein
MADRRGRGATTGRRSGGSGAGTLGQAEVDLSRRDRIVKLPKGASAKVEWLLRMGERKAKQGK